MRLVSLLLVALLAGSCASRQAAAEAVLGLAGLELGDTEGQVTSKLGAPISRTVSHPDYLPVTLMYRGLEVYLDEQGVGGALATNPRYCTAKGACPGDRYSRLAALYGSALAHEGSSVYLYGDGCWFKFVRRSEVIESVELACSP